MTDGNRRASARRPATRRRQRNARAGRGGAAPPSPALPGKRPGQARPSFRQSGNKIRRSPSASSLTPPALASQNTARSSRPRPGDLPQLLRGDEGSPPPPQPPPLRHLGWAERPRTPPPAPRRWKTHLPGCRPAPEAPTPQSRARRWRHGTQRRGQRRWPSARFQPCGPFPHGAPGGRGNPGQERRGEAAPPPLPGEGPREKTKERPRRSPFPVVTRAAPA